MYFEKNMAALIEADSRHEALRKQLLQAPLLQDDEYEFFETDDGHFTIKYRGVFLHHPEQPIEEIRNAFATQCTPAFDQVHLILGLGLGYTVEYALKVSAGKIVVYEPHQDLLRFIFENVDLSHHFTSGRVSVAAAQPDLMGMLSRRIYGDHQLDVLALKSYAYLLNDELPEMLAQILELTENWIQDYRTGSHFHFKWIEQFFNNYPDLTRVTSLEALVGRFRGKPALVISRGPSLDSALEAIDELSDSFVLIAVGGAIRRLWEAGITPDFAVFYDANGMAEQLHGIPDEVLSQITFLMSPFTQHCCFEAPSRRKMIFLGENNGQMARLLDAALGVQHTRVEGGGTVSLIAYQIAQAMACSPIVLAGQDLAFPHNQVYAGGIALKVDDNGHMALEKSEDLYAEPEAMATVAGQNGDILPTLKCYLSYIRHFEELADKNSRQEHPAELYNASLGGALIEGFELRPLSAFIGRHPAWKNGGSALKDLPPISDAETGQRRQALQQALQALEQRMEHGVKLCKAFAAANNAHDIQQGILTDFYHYTQQNPFLEYTILFEMLQYKRRFKEVGGQYDPFSEAVLEAAKTLLNNSAAIWREKTLPWIKAAQARLEALENEAAEPQATFHVF